VIDYPSNTFFPPITFDPVPNSLFSLVVFLIYSIPLHLFPFPFSPTEAMSSVYSPLMFFQNPNPQKFRGPPGCLPSPVCHLVDRPHSSVGGLVSLFYTCTFPFPRVFDSGSLSPALFLVILLHTHFSTGCMPPLIAAPCLYSIHPWTE